MFIWEINTECYFSIQQAKPKVPEIHAPPAQGGQVLEAPKIEVIREKSPDRKNSLAPGVYCCVTYFNLV